MLKFFCFFLGLFFANSAFAVVNGQYSVCAADPAPIEYCSFFSGSLLGCGLSKSAACGVAAAKVGLTTGAASNDSVSADMYCYDPAHIGNPGYAYVNFPLSQVGGGCPLSTTPSGTRCVVTAFMALPIDKQSAITVVSTRDTQAAADSACLSGIAAAQAGKSLDEIASAAFGSTSPCPVSQSFISKVSSADGSYHFQCIGKRADGTSFVASNDGINTPEGQAAAAAAAAAASAVAAASAAAAASASGGGAGQNSSDSGASSTSSTSPSSTMPDFVAASGIFYTRGTITGGKTLSDVLANFKTNIANVPIIATIRNFFKLDGVSGQCPSGSVSWSFFGSATTFDFSQLFCSAQMDAFLGVCGALFLVSAGFFAFRIVFL